MGILYSCRHGLSRFFLTKQVEKQHYFYIIKMQTSTAAAPPQRIPARNSRTPRGRRLFLGLGSSSLSCRMRFASFSISFRVPRCGFTSRRNTKYASSKYRLSPVRTTIICFCAPFITSASSHLGLLESICQALLKKTTACTKNRKKRCKTASPQRRRGKPSACDGCPPTSNTR